MEDLNINSVVFFKIFYKGLFGIGPCCFSTKPHSSLYEDILSSAEKTLLFFYFSHHHYLNPLSSAVDLNGFLLFLSIIFYFLLVTLNFSVISKSISMIFSRSISFVKVTLHPLSCINISLNSTCFHVFLKRIMSTSLCQHDT